MVWWAKALKNLISSHENERLDLFRIFPALRRFLAARHHHALLRTANDVIFILVLLSGFFGPEDPHRNVVVFLCWGLLWPGIVLSWFFVGRMWCGLCPFPGLGLLLQKKGLTFSWKIPLILKKYGVHVSVFFFALIIWAEIVAGLEHWPLGTAWLTLAIVLGSAIMAVFFPGQAWCCYLCPLGRISGAAATLSITEFRPDHEKCRGCETFACKRGKDGIEGCPVYIGAVGAQNNLHCLVCGHCLPLCHRDSPQLLIRNPYSELIRNKGRYITCSYIVPFLIGSQLARFFRGEEVYGRIMTFMDISDTVAFSLLLVLFFLGIMGVIRLGARMFGITVDPVFGKFSPIVPILIPMAFTGELVYRMAFFAEGIGDLIPTFGRQFGMPFLEYFSFSIPDFPIQVMSALFMLNGTIAGCYILWRFCLEDFEGLISLGGFIGINILVFLLLICYVLVIF
ncbi:MAG: (4Fe-4S)-binding protein [Thermodesulfobacteriota bacterium]|nr:(4Fe-4S)-binding protein [Thermodesulfobacteriota bacterium]